MYVEVAICTWNRSRLLDATLSHLADAVIPDDVELSVLVVNNNSTDDTEAVISRHTRHLPIRRLFESRAGVAHARNCAVAATEGELLLWTDDDVLVDPNWLSSYVRAARRNPQLSFFGGPIKTLFQCPPPDWVLASLPVLHAIVVSRSGEEELLIGQANPHDAPWGANFAVRTGVQRAYMYSPKLGRVRDGRLAGEESDVLARMISEGHRGLWIPEASVSHVVTPERLTRASVRRDFVGSGRTAIRMNLKPHVPASRLCARILRSELSYRLHRVISNHEKSVRSMTESSHLWGQLIEQVASYRRSLSKAA